MTNLEKYRGTWCYKDTITKHALTEYGVWKILGEDPNCDLGGHHHMPELGLVEGTLDEVIKYAVDLSGFWHWGSGGKVVKVGKPLKIKELDHNKQVQQQIEALEKEHQERIAKLKAQLVK